VFFETLLLFLQVKRPKDDIKKPSSGTSQAVSSLKTLDQAKTGITVGVDRDTVSKTSFLTLKNKLQQLEQKFREKEQENKVPVGRV